MQSEMHKSEYENIFKNEENHFFYLSLHHLVRDVLRRWNVPKNNKILDVGCGTGGLLVKLTEEGYDSEGIDISSEAIKYSLKRGQKVKIGNAVNLPYKNNTFDAVLSLDVLYHSQVSSDKVALKEMIRVLKVGGLLLIRVPAFESLRSAHDVVVETARRYTIASLKMILPKNIAVEMMSYINPSLFFLSNIKKMMTIGKSHKSDVGKIPIHINKIAKSILSLENKLMLMGVRWPVGQGIIMVARKSER